MEEEKKEVKRTRAPRKKRYYLGYQYRPKNIEFYGYKIVDAVGVPDLEAVQKELCVKYKTNQLVITSCLETK